MKTMSKSMAVLKRMRQRYEDEHQHDQQTESSSQSRPLSPQQNDNGENGNEDVSSPIPRSSDSFTRLPSSSSLLTTPITSMTSLHDLVTLPLDETPFSTTADIVTFQPEEVLTTASSTTNTKDVLTPLRPEEADECQLADILQGDDLSFLSGFDDDHDTVPESLPEYDGQMEKSIPRATTNSSDVALMQESTHRHRIPGDISFVKCEENGNKRRKLSLLN